MNYYNQNTFTYVNGLASAKSFQLMPGQTVLLIDMDAPYIYMRTSNSMGQSTMQIFEVKQITESDVTGTVEVKKDDLQALLERIERLEKNNESTIQQP